MAQLAERVQENSVAANHPTLPTQGLFECSGHDLGELTVNPRKNRIRTAIGAFEWGAYLGAKGMEMGVRCTVHGFRASFRTWADERTAYDHHTKETALAHVTHQRKVEQAYNRSDAFDRRRRLMDEWARYCATPATGLATVHKIGAARSA